MFEKITEPFRAWQKARQQRRIERLTAKAADIEEGKEYDLLFLHSRGFVRARGTGQSITRIYGDIENLIAKKLRVVIKPGTYFVARGNCQNMVAREEYSFTLYPTSTQHVTMDAACINANLPIPGEKDRFYGVRRVSDSVARFLEVSKREDPMVIQAGVWTLTDNYSRYDVINHLTSRDNRGNTWHPVTHDHCDKAKAILESLGISHRLWHSDVPYEKKTVSYDNGSYTGEFRHGERHGKGKYSFNDGGYYEGEWKNGTTHGEGTVIFEDGGKYVGKFEQGREIGGWYYYPGGGKSWSYRNADGKWEDPSTGQEREIQIPAVHSGTPASAESKLRERVLFVYGGSELLEASAKGDIETVTRFLRGGQNPNVCDAFNGTPLHYAVNKGRTEVVALLLEAGAEVNHKGQMGWTALHYAANKDRPEIAKMLIDNGASAGIVDNEHYTPLDIAMKRNRSRVADVLRKLS